MKYNINPKTPIFGPNWDDTLPVKMIKNSW